MILLNYEKYFNVFGRKNLYIIEENIFYMFFIYYLIFKVYYEISCLKWVNMLLYWYIVILRIWIIVEMLRRVRIIILYISLFVKNLVKNV